MKEFTRIADQIHESEGKLEEVLASQKEKLTVLQAKREEKASLIKEKKKRVDEALKDLEREEEEFNEIEESIAELEEFAGKESKKNRIDTEWAIERILKKSEKDPYLIGKCIGVLESLSLDLQCPICRQICSEDNPMTLKSSSNETAKGDLPEVNEKCLKCSDGKETKLNEEKAKKVKDLVLIKEIINRLKS